MKNVILLAGLALTTGLSTVTAGYPQASPQSTPKVTVGSALKEKAGSPTPPATAKNKAQKTSIGKGKTAIKTTQPSSSWVEQLDVDDDGSVETSDFLFDAQHGILYTYREDDFTCQNGKSESGSILEALYAKGNQAGKPVGSGWYLVGLNAGQCGVKQAAALGCKFDANGNPTECGAAEINYATGDLNVVVAQ
jgi:hypothetical protein